MEYRAHELLEMVTPISTPWGPEPTKAEMTTLRFSVGHIKVRRWIQARMNQREPMKWRFVPKV